MDGAANFGPRPRPGHRVECRHELPEDRLARRARLVRRAEAVADKRAAADLARAEARLLPRELVEDFAERLVRTDALTLLHQSHEARDTGPRVAPHPRRAFGREVADGKISLLKANLPYCPRAAQFRQCCAVDCDTRRIPMPLTDQQREQYRVEGFVVLPSLLAGEPL